MRALAELQRYGRRLTPVSVNRSDLLVVQAERRRSRRGQPELIGVLSRGVQHPLPAHGERQIPTTVGLGAVEIEPLDIVQEVGRKLVAAEEELALATGPRLTPEVGRALEVALEPTIVEVPTGQPGRQRLPPEEPL